jgi:HrpA-like RNA helicase
MGLGPVQTLLCQALDPPSHSALENAMAALYAAGAIRGGVRGLWLGCGWELTALGRILVRLPLDIRLGRMLVFAAIFGSALQRGIGSVAAAVVGRAAADACVWRQRCWVARA